MSRSLPKLILPVLLFPGLAWSQEPLPLPSLVFTHLTKADGLLSLSHNHVYQDSRNFIWLSSTQGLQRYDGHHFVNVLENELLASPSPSPGVFTLIEDSAHSIIAGTSDGIFVKRDGRDRFEKVAVLLSVAGDTVKPDDVGRFVPDHQGGIWFLSHGRLCRLTADYQVKVIQDAPPGSINYCHVEADERGRLWYTQPGVGFRAFDPATMSFISEQESLLLRKLNSLSLTRFPDRLVFTETHLLFYNGWDDVLTAVSLESLEITTLSFPDPIIRTVSRHKHLSSVLPDSRGYLWVAFHEHHGIARVTPDLKSFEVLGANNNDPLALHDDIYIGLGGGTIFVDRHDRIWYEGIRGLNICAPYDQAFQYFTNRGDILSVTETPVANGICTLADGSAFVGYYGTGLVRYRDNFTRKEQYPLVVSGETVDAVWTVFSPDGRHVIAPTQHRVAIEVDVQTDQVKVLKGGVFGVRQVNCAHVVSDTLVWLGHFRKSFSRWNYRTGAFTNYDSICFPENQNGITVRSIIPEARGRLWIFEDYIGAVLFDPATDKIIQSVPLEGPSIPTPKGNAMQGGDATATHLYMATTKGLVVYDLLSGEYMHYGREDGLADNTCYAVAVDEAAQAVWISTNGGLCRLDIATGTIHDYSPITEAADNRGDVMISMMPDKTIIYSVASGFIRLNPSANQMSAAPGKVRITQLAVNERMMNYDSLSRAGTIELGPDQRHILINFSAMHLPNNPGIGYMAYLEGADENWAEVDPTGSVEYRNLSPGTYTFHVKAVSAGGQAGDEAILTFVIKPYFWTTVWFWALIALVVIGSGYLLLRSLHRRRQRQMLAESRLKQALQEAENMALRAQMNPHFIFNCLNSINLFIADNNSAAATQYLSRFAKLIRLILDNSSNELIPLSKELSALELYIGMEELRFENRFRHRISISADVNPDSVQVPPLLVQPFVENAIWHGLMLQKNDPRLEIEVERSNGSIRIRVDDNGIGRERSRSIRSESVLPRRSIGMELARNRLKHLNAQYRTNAGFTVTDKTNGNGESAGTRVEIVLPLINTV